MRARNPISVILVFVGGIGLIGSMPCCKKMRRLMGPEPIFRPISVPVAAKYVSDESSGNYVNCSSNRTDYNFCTVYYSDGTIHLQGKFGVDGENRAATSSQLVYWFVDGAGIHLVGRKTLVLLRDRPKNVPSTAYFNIYGMGYDDYYYCSTERTDYNNCAIYRRTGEIIVQGRYRLKGYNRAATQSELRYVNFHENINLKDGKVLVPLSSDSPGGADS